jgi:hypothetical protein
MKEGRGPLAPPLVTSGYSRSFTVAVLAGPNLWCLVAFVACRFPQTVTVPVDESSWSDETLPVQATIADVLDGVR